MTLTDIENLSAAELKSQRAELIQAATKADHAELAARYIQARTDAKLRDEKLAEQGITITALHDSLSGCKATLVEEAKRASTAESEVVSTREQLAESRDVIEKLKANVIAVAQERDAAQQLAKDRRGVLAKIMQEVSPLLAAE